MTIYGGNAGRVTLNPMGEWDEETSYQRLDMVTYDEKMYVAKQANLNETPSTSSSIWIYMPTSGGSGDAEAVLLTRAEYDALPDTKLTDGKIYILTDEGGNPGDLEDLGNVELTNPTDGQALIYDADTETWINGNVAVTSVAGKTGAVTLVKGDVGLSNVDNTSDADKPISNATQTALNGKENTLSLITGSGTVNITVSDNTKYKYTSVSSLTMRGANVDCMGTVTFGSSTPSISVSGFTDMDGDDITSAAASETWEFNVLGGRCLWKNWG